MNYILLTISIFFETLKNGYVNYFGKKLFVTTKDTLLFNIVSGVGAIIFFVFSANVFEVSAYSLAMAAIFSLISAGAFYFSLMSLATGPMSASTLLVYMGSMVIPAVFGTLYYKQPVTELKIVGVVLMALSLVLSLNIKKDKQMSGRWYFYSAASFVFWGLVGIVQQIHQNSDYAGEINEFLFWSFVMMTTFFVVLYFVMGNRENTKNGYALKSKTSVLVMASGVLIAIVYKINLYLSGAMNPMVFFPIVNGGVLLLSSLAALVIFKEQLTVKQKIGMIFGIVSVCLLGI